MPEPHMRRRVWDMVREMVPSVRHRLNPMEQQIGVFLRGNEPLFSALKELIESRISGRAILPEPSDPIVCKSMIARDRELQWLLSKLEHIYTSPASETADYAGEPPAA